MQVVELEILGECLPIPLSKEALKSDINDHLTVGMTKTELLFVERLKL